MVRFAPRTGREQPDETRKTSVNGRSSAWAIEVRCSEGYSLEPGTSCGSVDRGSGGAWIIACEKDHRPGPWHGTVPELRSHTPTSIEMSIAKPPLGGCNWLRFSRVLTLLRDTPGLPAAMTSLPSPPFRSLPSRLGWTGGALVLTIAGVFLRSESLSFTVNTITPGVLYQSAALEDDELLDVVEELSIRTVVDLRMDDEEPGVEKLVAGERALLTSHGVDHVQIPTLMIPEVGSVEAFLAIMEDPARQPVLVHCKHGEGRSVLLSALFRSELEGWSREEARRATRPLYRLPWSSFGEHGEKGAFLLDYRRPNGGSGRVGQGEPMPASVPRESQ